MGRPATWAGARPDGKGVNAGLYLYSERSGGAKADRPDGKLRSRFIPLLAQPDAFPQFARSNVRVSIVCAELRETIRHEYTRFDAGDVDGRFSDGTNGVKGFKR